jgi:hypothetical protein
VSAAWLRLLLAHSSMQPSHVLQGSAMLISFHVSAALLLLVLLLLAPHLLPAAKPGAAAASVWQLPCPSAGHDCSNATSQPAGGCSADAACTQPAQLPRQGRRGGAGRSSTPTAAIRCVVKSSIVFNMYSEPPWAPVSCCAESAECKVICCGVVLDGIAQLPRQGRGGGT